MNDSTLRLIDTDPPEKWQQILADLITDPKELLEILELSPAHNPLGLAGLNEFPLRAPRPFVARIQRGNWNDPLLRQIWPAAGEADSDPGLNRDPLAESRFNPAPGLLHKYHDRVLLSVAPHCAIHCRYCFRRHFDYAANTPGRRQWRATLDYVRADPSIREVIFSGGDPLAAPDRLLAWLIAELNEIPQLTTLRLHTRLPIVIPQRVTPLLLSALASSRLNLVVVVHVNHAQELDETVNSALGRLRTLELTLLNQSVLLAGINDTVSALENLSRALFAHHVLPYYLHMPDPVAGTRHYQIDESTACHLLEELRARLAGYLVPRLVRETPGGLAKTPLL